MLLFFFAVVSISINKTMTDAHSEEDKHNIALVASL